MAQTIIVDISTRGANPVAYTHQGDTGRTFFAEIYENGEAFAVAGYTIKVGAILPADRGYTVIAGNDMVTATKTNDNTTNKIYFTLSDKYSLKAGNGILTLIFTSNTGTPSTIRPINIDLRIQKSADADDTIAGASDFPEGLEAIAEEVFQEYLSTYLPPVAPSASAAANKAADAKLTGEALDDLKSDLQSFAVGGEKTVTAATADDGRAWGVHQFELYILEGMTLTVTNNKSNYANIGAVPTSGENFSLMRSDGNTTKSVTITKPIKAIRIYSDVYPVNLVFSVDSYFDKYLPVQENLGTGSDKAVSTIGTAQTIDSLIDQIFHGYSAELPYSVAQASKRYPVSLVKGITYTITYSGSSAVVLAGYDANGASTEITSGALNLTFTPQTNIFSIGAWSASTGTLTITSSGIISKLNEEDENLQNKINVTNESLQNFVSGTNKTFSIDTASKEYMFPFVFLKGVSYSITNNTTSSCEVRVKNSSGTQTTVGTVSASRTIQYSPTATDIVSVGGWFNGTGTLDISSTGQLTTDSEQNEKIKNVSFNGTFTASDVESNRGYIERYGRFYTSQIWFSTDYVAIPILTKDTDLTIKSTIYANGGVVFYNSNKECILGIDGTNAADYGFESRYEIISRTITAPKGTAFIRICFYSWEQIANLAENLLISGDFGISTVANSAVETDARSEINERFDLCRWYDGTIYVTKNGVPQGSGVVIPNAANGRLYDRTLLFEDDFNGTALDTETWEYETGYKRNNEPQVYQAENVAVANSNLVITATRENVQAEKDGVMTDFEWTSGSIKCTMPYTYGRVEAKILFPSTVGSFGAFWGVGTVGTYPYCGEIDVIENNPSTSNPNNISCGAYGVVDNTNESFGRRFLKSYDQNGYHIYAVEISETSLEFYVDNDLVSTLDTSDESMSEFRTPYKWLLNLALSPESFGQAYQVPDDVDEYKMYVDWFRFYAPKET